jgi:hypothetical protein
VVQGSVLVAEAVCEASAVASPPATGADREHPINTTVKNEYSQNAVRQPPMLAG